MVASNKRLPQQGDSIGLETNTEDTDQNDENVNSLGAKINSIRFCSVSERHCEYQYKNIISTQETIIHNDNVNDNVLFLSLPTRQSTALINESVHDDEEQTNNADKQPRNMKNGKNMHNSTLVPGKMSANNITLPYVSPASLGSAEQPAATESAYDPKSPELVPEREESREQVTAYQRETEECEAPVSLGPQQTESSSKDSKSQDGEQTGQYLPDTLTAIGAVLTMLWGALILHSYFTYLLAVFAAVVIYDMIPPAINAGRSGKEETETAEAEGRTDKCRARGHSYKHQETDMNDGGPTSAEMKPVPLSDGVLSPSVTSALARRSPGLHDLETTFDLNLNEMQSARDFPLKDKAYRLEHTASWVCTVFVATASPWVDLVWRGAIIKMHSGVYPGVKKGKHYVETPVKELHAPFLQEDATGRDTDGLVLLTPSTDDTGMTKDTHNDTALNPKRVPYSTETPLKLGFVKATHDAKISVTIIVFLARCSPQTPVTLSVFLAILILMFPWRDYATKRDSDQDEEHDNRLALDDQSRGGRSASPPSTLETHIESLRKDVSGETNDGGTGNNSNEKNDRDNTSNGQQKQSCGRRNSDSGGEGTGGGRAASFGSGDGRDDDDDDDDNYNHRKSKTKNDAEDEGNIDNEDDDDFAEDDETQSDDQAEAVKEKSVDAVPAANRLLSLPQFMPCFVSLWSQSLTSRARVVEILRYFQHCLTLREQREQIYGAPMPNAFSGILLRTNPRGIILQEIHSHESRSMKSVNHKRLSRRPLRARYQGDGRVASYLVLTTITPWATAITFVFRLRRGEGGYVLLICRAEQNQLQPASSRNSETVIVAVSMILDTRERSEAPREMVAFRSHTKYMIALSMMYNVAPLNYFSSVASEHLGTPAATDPFVLNIQRGFMTALGMMNYTNMGSGQTRIQSVPTMGAAMLVATLMPRMNGSAATSTNPFERLFPWNVFATLRPALTQGSDVLPFVSDTVITNRPANGPAEASSFQRNSDQDSETTLTQLFRAGGAIPMDQEASGSGRPTSVPPTVRTTDKHPRPTVASGEARSPRSYGRETTSTERREGGDQPAVQPESVEYTRSVVQPESVVDTQSVIQSESVVDTRSVIQSESVVDTQSVVQPESVVDARSVVQPESVVDTRSVVQPATPPPHSSNPCWMHIGTGLTPRGLSCHTDGGSGSTGRAEDTRNLPPKLPPEAEPAQANEGHPVQCEADVRSRTSTVPVLDEEDGESGAEEAPDWGYNVAPRQASRRPPLVDVPAPARIFVKQRFTLVATCEDDSLENRLRQLEAENRRLRDRYLCRCCGDKMFNILLQPCQHMVCDVCFTRHWPRCPFCYCPIQQHVSISFA